MTKTNAKGCSFVAQKQRGELAALGGLGGLGGLGDRLGSRKAVLLLTVSPPRNWNATVRTCLLSSSPAR